MLQFSVTAEIWTEFKVFVCVERGFLLTPQVWIKGLQTVKPEQACSCSTHLLDLCVGERVSNLCEDACKVKVLDIKNVFAGSLQKASVGFRFETRAWMCSGAL